MEVNAVSKQCFPQRCALVLEAFAVSLLELLQTKASLGFPYDPPFRATL